MKTIKTIVIAASILLVICLIARPPGAQALTAALLLIVGPPIAIYLYFLPTLTAKRNHKANYKAILTLNILTGWTFIGWVVAMVWATSKDHTIPATPA
jgi:hypothetical protein